MKAEVLIDRAFEDLSHSLRVLLEANYHANRGLLTTDRAEAVGNIENALTSVLNAFHSLYDAIEHQLGAQPINWYLTGELAIILAIRNARHHNKANKIRTIYNYYVEEARKIGDLEQYVLVDFKSHEEGADTFDVYMSWADLRTLLSMPKADSRLNEATRDSISNYLCSGKFQEYAAYYQQPETRVFFNIVPLFVNAAGVIVPLIGKHIQGKSTESKFFADHFSDVARADTKHPEVNCGPFALAS